MKIKKPQLENPIFCAIDTPSLQKAISLGNNIKFSVGGIKVGLEFFSSNGPQGVAKLSNLLKLGSLAVFPWLKQFFRFFYC